MEVFRKKADLTQSALGQLCRVSQPRICNIENEEDTSPPIELLQKIARHIKFPGEPEDLQKQFDASKYEERGRKRAV